VASKGGTCARFTTGRRATELPYGRSGIGAGLGQLPEQHLCLLQVGGITALGKPAVGLTQQLSRFVAFAVALSQPTQARRRLAPHEVIAFFRVIDALRNRRS